MNMILVALTISLMSMSFSAFPESEDRVNENICKYNCDKEVTQCVKYCREGDKLCVNNCELVRYSCYDVCKAKYRCTGFFC